MTRHILLLLLITKGLIDLTWSFTFLDIGRYLNFQGLVALIVLMVAVLYALRRGLPRGRVTVPFILFCLMVTVSLFASDDIDKALYDYFRIIAGLSFFLIGHFVLSSERDFYLFCIGLIPVLLLLGGLGSLQILGFLPYTYETNLAGQVVSRLTCGYKHPLSLWTQIFVICPAIFYLFKQNREAWKRFILVMCYLLCLLLVGLSYLRMAFVLSFVQLALWLILIRKYKIVIFLFCATTVLVLFHWSMVADLFQTLSWQGMGRDWDQMLNHRGASWGAHIQHWKEMPLSNMIVGGGPYTSLRGIGKFPPAAWDNDAHCDLVRILVEHGIVGLLLYVWLMFSIISDCFLLIRSEVLESSQDLGRFLLVLIVSVLIMSITSQPTEEVTTMWYLFSLASIATTRATKLRARRSMASVVKPSPL